MNAPARLPLPERIAQAIEAAAARFDVDPDAVSSPADRSLRVRRARQLCAYRLYVDLGLSSRRVQSALGYAGRTGAEAAILRGAALEGRAVSRLSDLKTGKASRIDWCKFAFAVAGWREAEDLTQGGAARRAGVSRMVIIHGEQGTRLEAGTFTTLCAAMERDPREFLHARGFVTREMAAKQKACQQEGPDL